MSLSSKNDEDVWKAEASESIKNSMQKQ